MLLDSISSRSCGGHWRDYERLPLEWRPIDVREAKTAECVLGRPIPNTRYLTNADIELAKLRLQALCEGVVVIAGAA